MSSKPFANNKESQGYQAIRQDNAPPPYYQPPVVHDNIYQPVPHDQIQRQPIPNTVPAAVHKPPDVGVNNGSMDAYFFAAICMTACGLFMSSLLLLVCALPIAYCLYQASSVNDNGQKRSYLRAALFSSIAIMVFGIIFFLFMIIIIFAASFAEAQINTNY